MDVQLELSNMISRVRQLEHVVDKTIEEPLVASMPEAEKPQAAKNIILCRGKSFKI